MSEAHGRPYGAPKGSKGEATKEAIIDMAITHAQEVGLEGVSLGVLASSLSLSKSGLFAHFRSKEALQLAVLEEVIQRFSERVITPALGWPRGEPRVRALLLNRLAWAYDDGRGSGCFFASASAEYDDRPGPVRDRLVETLREWQETLKKAISLAIRERHFSPTVDPEQMAFEAEGIALSFQHAFKLLGDERAKVRAERAIDRLIEDAHPKKKN
ncbi:MAG: TetR/AcrR family transcriptional regulator [Myxococcota bacterium]